MSPITIVTQCSAPLHKFNHPIVSQLSLSHCSSVLPSHHSIVPSHPALPMMPSCHQGLQQVARLPSLVSSRLKCVPLPGAAAARCRLICPLDPSEDSRCRPTQAVSPSAGPSQVMEGRVAPRSPSRNAPRIALRSAMSRYCRGPAKLPKSAKRNGAIC